MISSSEEIQSRADDMYSLMARCRSAESDVTNQKTALDNTRQQLVLVTEQLTRLTSKQNELQVTTSLFYLFIMHLGQLWRIGSVACLSRFHL